MRLMKYAAAISGLVAVLGITSHADIAYQFSSDGTYRSSGSFAAGPYGDSSFLYQAIWSPSDPSGNQATTGGGVAAGEYVLASGTSTLGYGYVQPSTAGLLPNEDGDVGGADINAGFLYFRIFDSVGAAAGSELFQSDPVNTASGLVDVDLANPPIAPSAIAALNATGGSAQAYNSTVVPEPSTLALLAVSGVMIALRRARRD